MHNTEPKTISEKILERIEVKNMAPRSRLYFSVKNSVLWVLAAASVVVGGLAVSSILFRAINLGRVLPPGAPPPPLAEALYFVPFLWIVLFAAFGYLAYREIRSTKKGYRYELSTLLLGVALASLVLGMVFFGTGTGLALDRFAGKHIPFQKDLEGLQRERWQHPEEGFLVGVLDSHTETGVLLLDPPGTSWSVTFATSVPQGKKERILEGERIGVRGVILDVEAHTFLACDIHSLEFEGRPRTGMPPPGMRDPERNFPPLRSTECENVRTPN